VKHWKDYSEIWWMDGDGSPTQPEADGAREAHMIPLALYSLDHPRVPLLLIDFRDPQKPRRREMMSRAADDVATGVLGWTGLGHLPFLAVKASWSFVHERHGAALDRSARLRAYVQLRRAVLADGLEANLQRTLVRNLDQLRLNPFDTARKSEQENARRQYAALLRKVGNGEIAAHLAEYRAREAARVIHSKGTRSAQRLASAVTLRMYRHREPETPDVLAAVDKVRRLEWHQHYLEQVLAAGPRPEVVADMARVRRSLDALSVLVGDTPQSRRESARLIAAFWRLTASESSAGGQ
jgi:hypothetical protein